MSFEGEGQGSGDRIVVEVFSMVNVRTPVEELAKAVANNPRWRDKLDLRVNRIREWPSAQTPYGKIDDNTIVVSGKHVIKGNDYWGLQQALEACVGAVPEGELAS